MTFIVALALLIYVCSPRIVRSRRVSFVVVTLLSHQLRDGMRLGLWFWPLGSTPPIEYILYLLLELLLPFAMAGWEKWVTKGSGGVGHESGFQAVPQDFSDKDVGQDDADAIELRVVAS